MRETCLKSCTACHENEESIDLEAKQQRDTLMERWDYFTYDNNAELVADLPPKWRQGFVQRLSLTYPLSPSDYPRFEIWKDRILLMGDFVYLNQPRNTVREAVLALHSLGYQVSFRLDMGIAVLRWGYPATDSVSVWVALWTSFAWSGDNDSASQLRDIAKKQYLILVGEDVTFEETFGIPARKAISKGEIWCGL